MKIGFTDDLIIQYSAQPPIFDDAWITKDVNALKDKAEALEFKIDKVDKKIKKYKWMCGKRRS